MAELKSCPFCGVTPTMETYKDLYNRIKFGIACRNADCEVQPLTPWYAEKDECVNAWNKRTTISVNIYDKEETYPNCTVQVLTNTATGEVSVGWWKNGGKEDGKM